MKKKTGFFLMILLVLIGLTFCVEDEFPEGQPHYDPTAYEEESSTGLAAATLQEVIFVTCVSARIIGLITDLGIEGVITQGVCWSTVPNPTTSDNKTENGGFHSLTHFAYDLTGLSSGTTYYIRGYVKNCAGTAYGNEVSFTTLACIDQPCLDIDGNVYKTVQIGTQTWMAENLKTTRYNDGSQIPYITDLIDWAQLIEFEKFVECPQLTKGTYYWFDNDSSNKDIYGAIYNWYAVDRGNLCPTGWHVPTDAEWTKLEYFLGGTQIAGGKLKESGTTHWLSPNTGATNESGFTALPGAINDGYFGSDDWWLGDYDTGMYGLWWSASYYDIFGIYRYIINLYTPLYQSGGLKNCGASVRCLKD